MPFTLAHPVAILPISRRWPKLPLSALAVGSMAPDFPYFLLINNEYYHSGHTFRGVFTFCLPAGFAVLMAFHFVLKFPLLSLLPEKQIERLYPVAGTFRMRSAADLALACIGLVVGALTHIAMDSFTHYNGWSVLHLPFLASPWPVYKFLQYGGSLAGLWCLYVAYLKWFQQAPALTGAAQTLQPRYRAPEIRMYLGMLAAISLIAGVSYSACTYRDRQGNESDKKITADALESGMSAFGIGLTLFSLTWIRRHRAITATK